METTKKKLKQLNTNKKQYKVIRKTDYFISFQYLSIHLKKGNSIIIPLLISTLNCHLRNINIYFNKKNKKKKQSYP